MCLLELLKFICLWWGLFILLVLSYLFGHKQGQIEYRSGICKIACFGGTSSSQILFYCDRALGLPSDVTHKFRRFSTPRPVLYLTLETTGCIDQTYYPKIMISENFKKYTNDSLYPPLFCSGRVNSVGISRWSGRTVLTYVPSRRMYHPDVCTVPTFVPSGCL